MFKRHWRIIVSGLISLVILVFAFRKRAEILDAFALLRTAEHIWLVVAFCLILFSYFVSSQVFWFVLHSLGYRIGKHRLWATAIVAIVISQSFPAGGVGSYAFLVGNFHRRGVSSGESTLIASLETLSYGTAMLMVFAFSLTYFAFNGLATGIGSYLAGGVAVAAIGVAVFVVTRSKEILTRWLLGVKNGVARLLRRSWGDTWVLGIVNEVAHSRSLVAGRRRDVALLVCIQLTALCGHSLALLLIIHSLGGTTATFPIVLAAFGIALITSTFNVLPGGGGTVETALIAVLGNMGVGAAAVPAAVIFRLFNFWLMAPIAAACYHWLMHGRVPKTPARTLHYRERRPIN